MLTTAADLMSRLRAGESLTLLDVRWRLGVPDGRPDYLRGHIPGAVYVSLEDELTDHTVRGRGRHPLPSGAGLQAAARRWGVRQGQPVVVYDDWNRAGSARAWWVLTAAGLPDVRILDGGPSAWQAAGGALDTRAADPSPGDVTVTHNDLYAGALPTMTAEQVAAGQADLLLDARAPERFRGEVEPVDPVPGHIPGAVNLPSTSLLAENGTFLPAPPLPGESGAGSRRVAAYCGSGVTAAVVVAALRASGVDAALFPGSWSQWCADPARPVAVGPA